MFTGLVEETGRVLAIRRGGRSLQINIAAEQVLEGGQIGDSIAVNGVCLTVVARETKAFTADVMPETFTRTNLQRLAVGDRVSLERTLAVGDRFGGHIVQGHIDGQGTIRSLAADEIAVRVWVEAAPEILRYIVPKGSIAIDGISLTVVDVTESGFQVSLIPHSYRATTMAERRAGDPVNLEVDILAKYVERMLTYRQPARITESFLREHGFAD